jgi:hypothetical protein
MDYNFAIASERLMQLKRQKTAKNNDLNFSDPRGIPREAVRRRPMGGSTDSNLMVCGRPFGRFINWPVGKYPISSAN